MKMRFLLAAAAGLMLASVSAAITPVAWKQSNAFSAARTADKLSNAIGMDSTQSLLFNQDGVGGVGETAGADGKYWLTTSGGNESTAASQGRVWLVADLGASYDLSTIRIWNFQWNLNGSTNLSNRGTSQFDMLVRNTAADTDDGTIGGTPINLDRAPGDGLIDDDAVFNPGTSNPWQEVISNQALAQAPNNDSYTGQSFDLTGTTARFVAIRVDSYYGGGGVGLGKLRFQRALTAYQPDPADGGTGVELNLSGQTVPGAVSWVSPDSPDAPEIVQVFGYNVYMDTDQTKVANATPASGDLLYKSLQSDGQTTTSFTPGAELDYGATYYWRVDSVVDEASVPGTTLAQASTLTGKVWSFEAIAPAGSPTPNHGESNEALSAKLSWQSPATENFTYHVYFGTDPDAVAQAGNADYDDLAQFAGQWLRTGDLESDLNDDGKVDFTDFSSFANGWGSPEFKGHQSGTSFDPGGLEEATQYYWRVDAIDESNQVYPGEVWTFNTYDTQVIQQAMVDCYDQDGVPAIITTQKMPGYDPVNDPNDILAGQFGNLSANEFNIRRQEVIYSLAYVYREPRSDYYRNPEILNRVLLNLDYICRAQGSNGGFNEKVEASSGQTGWCGVALPDGGNNTRTSGASTVTGFTMWLVGRSIVLLQNEPAFVSALDVFIDNDGNGTKDVRRLDAYKYLFDNNINGGSMTGVIECMMIGRCKGGRPNQDCGALAAVQSCNEAYRFLNNGTAYLTQAQLDTHRDRVLFDNASIIQTFFDPTRRNWWTDKFMILENGHGALGYDTGYGHVPIWLLGTYARNANDDVVGGFIGNYMNGYQYFYVLDDAWPSGGYWEWRTARRQGEGVLGLYGFGISQPYHPAFEIMFDKTLSKFAKDPSIFLDWFWPSGLEPATMGELLLNWSDPVASNYVLPCNRPETFTYTDLEANLEVTKTGVSPETVTWTAFNWDGGTKSYTYEAP